MVEESSSFVPMWSKPPKVNYNFGAVYIYGLGSSPIPTSVMVLDARSLAGKPLQTPLRCSPALRTKSSGEHQRVPKLASRRMPEQDLLGTERERPP